MQLENEIKLKLWELKDSIKKINPSKSNLERLEFIKTDISDLEFNLKKIDY